MDNVPQWRRTAAEVQGALREVGCQLTMLNRRVGARLSLRDADLECLDLVSRHGPLSPSALAKRAGVHPATMTGVLDRLEKAGWITRERDPDDRRAVVVRVLPDRVAEVYDLYAGMRTSLNDICRDYDEGQLAMIAEFLNRVADAGERAVDELSGQ